MSTDERTDAPTLADQSAEATRPRLRLHHLFALTAVMAVLLAIGGPRRDFGGGENMPPQLLMSFWMVLGVFHQILAAVAVTALTYGIAGYRRGQVFFDQPGHWLLAEISLITLLGIPPTLVYRSMTFSSNVPPGDFQMSLIMIAGMYYFLILFLGRMVANIYLGITKCVLRRWRFVFFAKALASITLGLGDILVIPLLLKAVGADRREQLSRDGSHRCGVVVQLGLSALSIAIAGFTFYNVSRVWWR